MGATLTNNEMNKIARNILNILVRQDVNQLRRLLDELQETHGKERIANIIGGKYIAGKSLLEVACALGMTDQLHTFIRRGANVTRIGPSGYGLIHYAACWGNLECIELLYEVNSGMEETKTKNGETPKQLALRYGHIKCADFLDWAESERVLQSERPVPERPVKEKRKA